MRFSTLSPADPSARLTRHAAALFRFAPRHALAVLCTRLRMSTIRAVVFLGLRVEDDRLVIRAGGKRNRGQRQDEQQREGES